MTLPISVVIPCYRQEQYVARAIESAWEAGAYNVLVFQDDYLTAPKITHPRAVKFNSSFRAGVCFGRNSLIQTAQTDLIFCLDADDRLYPDALERIADSWQPDTWVYGKYTEIDESENVIQECDVPPPGMIYRKNLAYCSFLFHREAWVKSGGYDPLFEFGDEDFAFQVALTDAGVRPIRLDGAPIYQRMIHPRGSRTERAVKYFPMVLELLREKYPATMHP